jgi:hypothetical protein
MFANILTRAKDEIKWRLVRRTVENPDANWFVGLRDALSLDVFHDIIVATSDGRVHSTMGLDPDAIVTIDGAAGPLHEMVNQIPLDSKPVTIGRDEALNPQIDYVFGDFDSDAECVAGGARRATDVLTSDLTTKEERLRAWSCVRDVHALAYMVTDHCDKLLDKAPAELANYEE